MRQLTLYCRSRYLLSLPFRLDQAMDSILYLVLIPCSHSFSSEVCINIWVVVPSYATFLVRSVGLQSCFRFRPQICKKFLVAGKSQPKLLLINVGAPVSYVHFSLTIQHKYILERSTTCGHVAIAFVRYERVPSTFSFLRILVGGFASFRFIVHPHLPFSVSSWLCADLSS